MNLGDVITSATPCCNVKVKLTVDGPLKWARHCLGAGCHNVYDVKIVDGQLQWTLRKQRRAA